MNARTHLGQQSNVARGGPGALKLNAVAAVEIVPHRTKHRAFLYVMRNEHKTDINLRFHRKSTEYNNINNVKQVNNA